MNVICAEVTIPACARRRVPRRAAARRPSAARRTPPAAAGERAARCTHVTLSVLNGRTDGRLRFSHDGAFIDLYILNTETNQTVLWKCTDSALPVVGSSLAESAQVGDNKRLCHAGGGKGTENRLLVQISEADQVSDFERILNSNEIVRERRGHVWRGCGPACAPSASVAPRGGSAYSLLAVSQAYHYLFRQHEESLQPLIDRYRRANADQNDCPPDSFLDKNWFENLQDLSEYYEDDQALKKEVETITDRIIAEEVQSSESPSKEPSKRHKYFNVNLADLFGLRVNGEGYSPCRDEVGPSPDVERAGEVEEEWRAPSMSANSDDHDDSRADSGVDRLARSLTSVQIDGDAKVPTITFSDCCDGRGRSELPSDADVLIHLAVPSVDGDEARPPMM